jgi:hypothetical protein
VPTGTNDSIRKAVATFIDDEGPGLASTDPQAALSDVLDVIDAQRGQ